MIRQLPKMTLPSVFNNEEARMNNASDIKIYDVITPSTANNTEGNTMQLQLFQKDSAAIDPVRQLHGRLTLNTESLPDNQDIKFGFMFSSQETDNSKYDGLELKVKKVSADSSTPVTFQHKDISAEDRPDIFSGARFKGEKQNDWVVIEEDSYAVCEEPGRCELSVAFVRNFDTLDHENDIAL